MPDSMQTNASRRLFCCHDAWMVAEPADDDAEGQEAWATWFDHQPPVTVTTCQRCNGGWPVGA